MSEKIDDKAAYGNTQATLTMAVVCNAVKLTLSMHSAISSADVRPGGAASITQVSMSSCATVSHYRNGKNKFPNGAVSGTFTLFKEGTYMPRHPALKARQLDI